MSRDARLSCKKLIRFAANGGTIICLAVGLADCGGGGGGSSASVPALPGSISLLASTFDVTEGAVVNIRVNRSGGSSGSVSVDYSTTDGNAVGGTDYLAANGTLTWPNDVSGNRTISIPIPEDDSAEYLETFTVTLNNVSGATLGANSSATVNILDNDSASLSVVGPITALNSATVNAVDYETDSTSVFVNGQPGTLPDLKLGHVVVLEGEANLSEGTGTADSITYESLIIGPVESFDAALNQLIVLGQTVFTTAETEFDSSINPDTFSGLAVGDTIQVSGFRNSDGDTLATRVDPDTTSVGVQLIGPVSSLDLANFLFSISRILVDYADATVIDLPTGMPANGMTVLIRGSLVDGILVVDRLLSASDFASAPEDRIQMSGLITRFVSPTDFDINGVRIITDSNTTYIDGAADDLQANAEVAIDGGVTAGGSDVLASVVFVGRPVSSRGTVTFDFENFTNLTVFGMSRVTVDQGSIYAVEIAADSEIVNDVEVTQNGDTVSLGSTGGVPSRIYTATVTMPVLDRIDIDADAITNVLLKEFMQAQMTVNVDGVSVLRGEELSINDLVSSVSGVSVLQLGDIRPILSADIDISGISQATLNMGVGSTLSGSVTTGQGTGTSNLYYYGTGVTVAVTTDAQSSVVVLGDTRP